MLLYSFLSCKISVEKSADSLMGAPVLVTNFFSLSAFIRVSLSLIFGILIMMCLSGGLGVHLVWNSLYLLDLFDFFLHQVRNVFCHFFKIGFSMPFSLSSPSSTPMVQKLAHLKLLQTLLTLSSFGPFFSFCCSDWIFSASFQIADWTLLSLLYC